MNDDLRNPMALFDISGKVAIVTGASGAFGAHASKVLGGAGARLVVAAGNKAELDVVATQCRDLGAEVEALNVRPDSEGACEEITKRATARFGSVDILVVASGKDHSEYMNTAQQVARLIPDAEVVEMAQVRHWPAFEDPETFNTAALRFLRG